MKEEKENRRKGSRLRKWLLGIVVFVLLILAAGRWLMQSDLLLDYLRDMAEQEVSAMVNGSLSIERLDGDLWSGVALTGVELRDEGGESLASTDTLRVSYSILNLLRQPYELNEVVITGLHAYGVQDEEGVWNFENLITEEADPQEEAEETEMPFWKIGQLRFHQSSLSVRSPLLPDEELLIDQLEFDGNIGYEDHEWAASVQDLRFLIDEGRLIQPVEVGASARVDEEHITLERLLVNTGRSLVRSQAEAEGDRQVEGELEISTLSWRDIREYMDVPLEQDLEGSIEVGGSLADLRAGVHLRADGLEAMSMDARFHFGEEFSLSEFNLQISHFDGPLITGDPDMPRLGSAGFSGSGQILFDRPEESHFSGEMTLTNLGMEAYALDFASLDLEWLADQVTVQMDFSHNEQAADAQVTLQGIFDELPGWQVALSGSQINVAELLAEPDFESSLNLEAEAEGRGFELSEEKFNVVATLMDSRWGDQPVDQFEFDGYLSAHDLSGMVQAAVGDSRVSAGFSARNWQTDIAYDFTTRLSEFNMADIRGFEDLPTNLNATIEGDGANFSLDELEMTAEIHFGTSFVNEEEIETLTASLGIRNQIAVVTEAELESPIADAVFSFRQHLQDFRDPGNTFDMDAQIKEISTLAPFFGVETVQARGDFSGHLFRRDDGELQFDAELGLREIAYDTLFTIDEVEGLLSVLLLDDPVIDLDLDIQGPAADEYRLQLVSVAARTVWQDTLFTGSMTLDLQQDDDNSLSHAGEFRYMENDLFLNTEELVLRTPDRPLSLLRPFELSWRNEVLQMDTLHIESPAGSAYLQMAVPWLDEHRQEVTMNARWLNLGTIQRLVLNDSFAEALVSGHLNVVREENDITSDASLLFERIRVNEGSVDSLRAVAGIANNRLTASVGAWYEQTELLAMKGDLPFEPDDPMALDDEFFDQQVEGEIRIPSTAISFWRQFLDEEYEFETEGDFSLHAVLGGTAGEPVFTGDIDLSDGNLSGVPIDLVEFAFDYRHELTHIRFDGSVHSRGSRIAGVEAVLPLDLDMRELRVNLPEDEDDVYVSARTDDLNLAILNDFLDPDLMRDLRGRITGDLEIRGTVGSPEPSGFLSLTGGRFRVVPAAVTLGDIAARVNLAPEQVQLESFSMSSGPGRLTASGQVELAELQPGDLDITVRANQFRVVNTADMNAIVDIRGNLQGTLENPVLAGSVNFLSGFVNLQNFGEQAIEDVRLEDEPEPETFAFYDSLAAEMTVEFDRQFFIRNRQYLDMEVELAGIVDLVKEPDAELELFGSIEGVRGYAQPLGRNFELDEAVVTFYGPVGNPELLIRTFYMPPQAEEEVTLWYIIEGTVEGPDFRFESEPDLELQDIVSYTLFGRPFYALESWQQAVSGGGRGTTAADVALDLLLDRVELLAAQQLGIDVVQVDTNRTGSGSSTTIKTGWYLGNRTFFAVLNEITGTSPKTMFQLEYMIRRNLEFIVTQGDDNREGVDLRWNFDY